MLLVGLTPNRPEIDETSSQTANAAITHDQAGRRRGWKRTSAAQKTKVISMSERAKTALPTTKGKTVFWLTTSGVVRTRQMPVLTIRSRTTPGGDDGAALPAGLPAPAARLAGENAFAGCALRRLRRRDMTSQQLIMASEGRGPRPPRPRTAWLRGSARRRRGHRPARS